MKVKAPGGDRRAEGSLGELEPTLRAKETPPGGNKLSRRGPYTVQHERGPWAGGRGLAWYCALTKKSSELVASARSSRAINLN